jgi:hypothetical protein
MPLRADLHVSRPASEEETPLVLALQDLRSPQIPTRRITRFRQLAADFESRRRPTERRGRSSTRQIHAPAR